MEFKFDYKTEEFILNTKWEDFPDYVKERALVCSIDLFMSLIIGSRGEQFSVGERLARALYRDGNVPVIGSANQYNFLGATVAMAHASNSFDIDDGHNLIRGHPGTSFVAGVLAAALEKKVSYKEYLTTLVVCYEISVRWALAMQDHYHYLHSTGAYGAFGTAAGVGRLYNLNKDKLNNALSIADFHAPMVPVMRSVQHPSMNKDGVPQGALIGATAIMETIYGSSGKTHLLELEEYAELLDSLHKDWQIMNLYFKPYTCCRWAHQPIKACIDLMNEHKVTSDQVEQVIVHTFEAAARLSKIVPKTTDEAQYNIAYPVAAAIVHGDLGFEQIRDEALNQPEVLEMMRKLKFIVDPSVEKQFPEKRLARVELRIKGGQVVKSDYYAADGESSDNVNLCWIKEKFKRITSPLLMPDDQEQLFIKLESLDSNIEDIVKEINELLDKMPSKSEVL